MHIKALKVEGFKAYKNLTVIDEFHEGHNVVVGRNGSGKSCIFDAIAFVMSDKYANLRLDERSRLLYDATGDKTIMNASVEIIFDNSDNRFPFENDEVSLKRTIGYKKDEFFVDNRHVTKKDVSSLLESAGLSSSNPYYIVAQGKVQTLIKMKNSERLDLLKEIAGTRVYDDRRKESMKIMSDTDKKRTQINEVIEFINKRLNELEEEKGELKEYQELDVARRCLEYAIYDTELENANNELDAIEENREKFNEEQDDLHSKVSEASRNRANAEEEMRNLMQGKQKFEILRDNLMKEKEEAIKLKAKHELAVQVLEEKQESEEKTRATSGKEQVALEKKIKETQTKLEKAKHTFGEKMKQENDLKLNIELVQQRLKELYDKEGRSDQFANRQERDKFLKKEIEDVKKSSKNEKGTLKHLEDANASARKRLQNSKAKHISLGNDVKKIEADIKNEEKAYSKLKAQRDKSMEARKELWRKRSGGDGMQQKQDVMKKLEKDLQYTMDKSTYKGLEAVKRLTEKLKLKGVHGPLIDLFSVDEKFEKCVETTAGGSLFHVVVENEEIASKLIQEINKEKLGARVTFMPLANMNVQDTSYPSSIDVIAMIDKLSYQPKFKKAMMQVFGKTLITRDLRVGSEYARAYKLNTITIEGDQVNRKGALTGGYIDNKKSRLGLQKQIKSQREAVEEAKEETERIKSELEEMDVAVNTVLGDLNKCTNKKTQLRNTLQQIQLDSLNLDKSQDLDNKSFDSNAQRIKKITDNIKLLEEKASSLTNEMQSEFLSALSAEDQAQLKQHQESITEYTSNSITYAQERSETEIAYNTLVNLLERNLKKRLEELKRESITNLTEDSKQQLEQDRNYLQLSTESVSVIERRFKELLDKRTESQDREKELQKSIDALKEEEEKAQNSLSGKSKHFEKLLNKRGLHQQRRDECTSKIRELGTLPEQAKSDKYKKLDSKKMMSNLEQTNKKLKEYSHVNKRAIDQYTTFTDQKEDLESRKKELDQGRKAIEKLISNLDNKKEEAIQLTFKGIAKHFCDVFKELVPNGKGSLVMQTTAETEEEDDEENKEDDDEDDEDEDGSSRGSKRRKSGKGKAAKAKKKRDYTGIGIKVSFSGKEGSKNRMMQLSGGQQSVVALSLIFAIQRADPCPFYLFDEIDSNLDSAHRTSVNQMIKSQSKNTQFITTTFRPEMLATADKFFGVTYSSKRSQVNVITREEAYEMLKLAEKQGGN